MISVAIDGPAGAGKSTIAKLVSKELGFIYIDTGALYRSIGYFVLKNGGDIDNSESVVSFLPKIEVELKFIEGVQHVFVNGEDVSDKIRTEEVSQAASKVSAIPKVREFLLELQRSFAKKYNVVMDGRDIGTVVLPNANVKIFLTASAEVRANRRYKEQIERGLDVDYDSILNDIKERDFRDENREIAPLKCAEDGVYLDSSDFSIEQNVAAVLKIIKEKGEV
ncbi:MAG: (d)CMP kinase [Clostridia bacterium]|nr:(d)CMP kinase [Clostridia bacterium]